MSGSTSAGGAGEASSSMTTTGTRGPAGNVTTSQAVPSQIPPGLFKRQSSTSLSRRTSTSSSSQLHTRSPVLQPVPDRDGPHRFHSSNDEQNRLLNAMEAEEEALVIGLSRKLEQLRKEKVELESTLEMEQEGLVNRLQRQLSTLLSQQQQNNSSVTAVSLPSSPFANDLPLDMASSLGARSAGAVSSPIPTPNLQHLLSSNDPAHPPQAVVIEALQSENVSLRSRLADAQNQANQAGKTSEMYRQELINLRTRAGLDISDLLYATSSGDVNSRQSSSNGYAGGSRSNIGASTAGVRIPGISNSPPVHSRHPSHGNKYSYGASYSPSTSSALSPSYSASPMTHVTTPSTSYTTPQVPASTPVTIAASLASQYNVASGSSTGASNTPYGSVTSSSSLAYPSNPPPSLSSSYLSQDSLGPSHSASRGSDVTSPYGYTLSNSPIVEVAEQDLDNLRQNTLQRRLSSSKHGARVAETGNLLRRSSSNNRSTVSHDTRPAEPASNTS